MNGKKMLVAIVLFILLGAAMTGAAAQRIEQPVRPAAYLENPSEAITVTKDGQGADAMSQSGRSDFTVILHGGVAEKLILGPCARPGGYAVDITPLRDGEDGAYIEKQILPEFDGQRWVDVLTLLMPSDGTPLKVQVQVYSTADWPRAFEGTLSLEPGAWHGFIIQDAAVAAGYVIEINPQGRGEPGDRVERTLVQPEFADAWWDVLRVQIPEGQATMEAEVIVYQTPADLPVVLDYEFLAEPGAWYGFWIGDSQTGGAYVLDVTPLWNELSQIERYTIQQECDEQTWIDSARVMVSPDWPPMQLRVTVYLAGGG